MTNNNNDDDNSNRIEPNEPVKQYINRMLEKDSKFIEKHNSTRDDLKKKDEALLILRRRLSVIAVLN